MNTTSNGKKRIAVGLSGGVDSAVAAMLLNEAGYEVCGVHLQCWDYEAPGCSGDRDRADAAKVASVLGIRFEHLDFVALYKEKVLEYFYNSYEKGLTPNPDILCNSEIKFGAFLDWALGEGFDYVATGHYARVERHGDCVSLLRPQDVSKDQSYFLYRLDQAQLEKILFPLGDLLKREVRALALEAGMEVHDKPDSTGICFIGDVDVREFLRERLEPSRGKVVLEDGREVGWHEGAWFYTVGQRRGFTVTDYVGIPLYVIDKDVEKNELVVGPIKSAYRDSFDVISPCWICKIPSLPVDCQVRIRNLGKLVPATVSSSGENRLSVVSKKPLFGVAPGQSAVFYQEDKVLGGGFIL
jgi:tRNA-uridine 2-sulfurtransferase